MLYFPTLISIIEVALVLVPALLAVAYVTVAERKTMASMQRRLGPNVVGYYGLLQAFADALKLLLKVLLIIFRLRRIFVIIQNSLPVLRVLVGLYRSRNHIILPAQAGTTTIENINFFLCKLITIIYTKIKFVYKPERYIDFFIIALFVYCTLEEINLYLAMLFYNTFISLAFSLFLVNIINNLINNISFRDNFPILHSIILYFLVSLLIYCIYLFVITFYLLCDLSISIFKGYILKTNFISKFKDFKLSLEYKYFKSKDPKNPKSIRFFTAKEKKEDAAERKKLALKLREKLFNLNRTRPCEDPSAPAINSNEISFGERRNWKETINIEKSNISNSDILKKMEIEFKAYDTNEKKFKEIIVNIGKGKEGFYPNDSISEFNESIRIIKDLKSNLKSTLKIIEQDLKKK